MATVIKIKRSQLAAAPAAGVLQEGELAYSQDRSGSGALAKLYIHSKNAAGAEVIHEVGGKYFTDIVNTATALATSDAVVRRDNTGSAAFNNLTVEGNLTVVGNQVIQGNTEYAGATTYAEDVVFEGDIAVNGGDITSTASTFNFVNTGVSTLNVGGDATAIAIGSAATTTTFAGTVSIGGSLTVAENATVAMDFSTNNATITGNLMVDGNTTLGNDATVDTTTIKGVTTVSTGRTKDAAMSAFSSGGASALIDAFKVVDSAGVPLFEVKDNGDTVIAGVLAVNGAGTSTFAGNVSIGGSLTVAENATVTMDFTANDATITGNLFVEGNTTLGNEATDTVSVVGTLSAAENASFAKDVSITGNLSAATITTTGNVTIGGDLTVNGTTTTVNSTTTTLTDPVLSLAKDTSAADAFDRGIDFKWHNGTEVKIGFFGFDDSAEKFTFIKDATNTSGEYSGVPTGIVVGGVDAAEQILAKGGIDGFAADGTTRSVLANFELQNVVIDAGEY